MSLLQFALYIKLAHRMQSMHESSSAKEEKRRFESAWISTKKKDQGIMNTPVAFLLLFASITAVSPIIDLIDYKVYGPM